MKKEKRKQGPLARRVHIDEQEWQWQMYGGGHLGVKIRDPNGNDYLVHEWDILNMNRNRWWLLTEKDNISVTPKHIKDYIINHINVAN